MTEIEQLAEQIADSLASKINTVPLRHQVWNAQQVGDYLGVSPHQIRNRYSKRKGFPAPIPLPSNGGQSGRLRWKTIEIIEWVDGLRE